MKKMLIVWMMTAGTIAFAQTKVDEERMQRDIEIAENILSTMLRQQIGQRSFFPMEVQGSYLAGYGVTFRLPSESFGSILIMQGEDNGWNIDAPVAVEPVIPGEPPSRPVKTYNYSYSSSEDKARAEARGAYKSRSRAKLPRGSSDSSKVAYNKKMMESAKNFIADYGDLLSQLPANEKIIITNRGEGQNNLRLMMWGGGFEKQKQNMITVEGTRSDVNQFRQGKLTRDQLFSKFRIVNSEVSDELQPDLELLTSIFNRLYSRDLSKTFFCDENIYYEKLKDYGAIYHMQVYASNQIDDDGYYIMPTVHLSDLDQQARDKKVKELYPEFEKSIREDLLEYGRTLKSLKEEEVLMLEIQMTRCKGCNIPSSLELSIKNSTLKDYASGKISKEAALAKITLKKGPDQ